MPTPVLPELPPPWSGDFRLRPLRHADAADWYAYLRLPEVFEHTSWQLGSVADLDALFAQYESGGPDAPLRFALAGALDDRLVGTIGFHTISRLNRTAELAYDLAPSVWGLGLATAAAQAAIRWMCLRGGFLRIQATTLPVNKASIRVMERCGMQREGLLRHYRLVRGVPRDFLMYALLAEALPRD